MITSENRRSVAVGIWRPTEAQWECFGAIKVRLCTFKGHESWYTGILNPGGLQTRETLLRTFTIHHFAQDPGSGPVTASPFT